MHNQIKLSALKKKLTSLADPGQAKVLSGFFKTGKGQYGEGDRFLGVKVPAQRKLANEFKGLPFGDVEKLLRSKIHEFRLVSLMILIEKYQLGSEKERIDIIRIYLANTKYINNWDLVDLSAGKLLGRHLLGRDTSLLVKMAKSRCLWERRIAIIATYHFIKNGGTATTFQIAELLLGDDQDLIHKAVGWMLREAGKRDRKAELRFLDRHAALMPRTMLRYAIEKFPEPLRRSYLARKKETQKVNARRSAGKSR